MEGTARERAILAFQEADRAWGISPDHSYLAMACGDFWLAVASEEQNCLALAKAFEDSGWTHLYRVFYPFRKFP